MVISQKSCNFALANEGFVLVIKGSYSLKLFFAEIAQLVEHNLAKVGVAGSSPVFRSQREEIGLEFPIFLYKRLIFFLFTARMVEW